jgi:hypothetical protein
MGKTLTAHRRRFLAGSLSRPVTLASLPTIFRLWPTALRFSEITKYLLVHSDTVPCCLEFRLKYPSRTSRPRAGGSRHQALGVRLGSLQSSQFDGVLFYPF